MSRKRKPSSLDSSVTKRVKDDGMDEEDNDDLSSSLGLSRAICGTLSEEDEAEVGVIEKISLKNFMCHERLDFTFGPKVNFITGQNGSGKSAILTAIVIGLGGKAVVTNRGTNVKNFIMHGKQSAEVMVKLRNRGTDAFKHDVYGDSIIVERKLSADGGTHYCLKNIDGQTKSNKRDELAHLLEHFNIQVDNPIAILNQDTSRNFLHTKHASDKYKLFLKATQLEQMKNDYNEATESKTVAQEILKQKDETLPDMYKEVSNWEHKYKASLSLDELRTKVETLKNEMVWTLIYEKEKKLKPLMKELSQAEQRMPKLTQKSDESQAKVCESETAQQASQEELRSLEEQVARLEPRRAETNDARAHAKRKVKISQSDHRQSLNDLSSLQKERQQILERIDEIKDSTQVDYEGERRAREERIEELHGKLAAMTAKQKTTEQSLSQFQGAVAKHEEDKYRLTSEERDARQQVERTRRDLTNLEASRANKLRQFGEWMPELLRQIDMGVRDGRFHKRPRGPLGACLSLRDPSWALAVESCLKSLMQAFCVHDHDDEKLLEAIFNSFCPARRKPVTITSMFSDRLHDVSSHRVRSETYRSVQDMLQIDDYVVENCLIDQRGIETILLIKDSNEARQLMSSRPPRNCREAFTIEGDQLHARPVFRYYSTDMRKSMFLTASLEDNIRLRGEDVRRAERAVVDLAATAQRTVAEMRSNRQEEQRCGAELRKLNDAIGKIRGSVTDLQNIEDPAPIDVTTLEEEVGRYEGQISRATALHARCEEALATCRTTQQAADKQFENIDLTMRELTDRVDPINEQLVRIEDELRRALALRQHYELKKAELQQRVTEFARLLAVARVEIDTAKTGAKQRQFDEVTTRRTSQNINREICQINTHIAREEENWGNHEEIQRRYHEVVNSYGKIKREVGQLKNFLTILDKEMLKRKGQYQKFRGQIALRTKHFFILMLHFRNYRGSMDFDHKTGNLALCVQPQHMKGGASNLKALSGGERSFTTVCFILALWEAMESPFRCLDEFDVFMDMLNRKISLDMMMKMAEKQRRRQFIFLTPLDMSQLNVRGVCVFKMDAPQRDQPVLPFTPRRRPEGEEEADEG